MLSASWRHSRGPILCYSCGATLETLGSFTRYLHKDGKRHMTCKECVSKLEAPKAPARCHFCNQESDDLKPYHYHDADCPACPECLKKFASGRDPFDVILEEADKIKVSKEEILAIVAEIMIPYSVHYRDMKGRVRSIGNIEALSAEGAKRQVVKMMGVEVISVVAENPRIPDSRV